MSYIISGQRGSLLDQGELLVVVVGGHISDSLKTVSINEDITEEGRCLS